MRRSLLLSLVLLLVILSTIGWYQYPNLTSANLEAPTEGVVDELGLPLTTRAVVPIPLTGPLAEASAEVSGMTWWGDTLLLLPQYPNQNDCNGPCVFEVSVDEIDAVLDGRQQAIRPRPISGTLIGELGIAGFEGFEAIALAEGQLFLLAESETAEATVGHLLRSPTPFEPSGFELDCVDLTLVEPSVSRPNMAFESLLSTPEGLVAMPEVNGLGPAAGYRMNLDTRIIDSFEMPSIPYRLTDVTRLSDSGYFWALNVHWPQDGLAMKGIHPLGVERLIRLRWDGTSVQGPDAAITLELDPRGTRNWEGVALHRSGALLITDEHPQTVFAWVDLNNP